MLSLFFSGPLSQASPNPMAAVHYQATACLKPACGQARAHKAPLVRVESACARARSSPCANGASHASALPSRDLSFAHKHKCPLLKCPPLARVELHAQTQVPVARASGAFELKFDLHCASYEYNSHLPTNVNGTLLVLKITLLNVIIIENPP